MSISAFDTDVLIIGSGFGASVAALRFAEQGYRVTILERGPWIKREHFEADADMFWFPHRHRYGMNELRARGRHIIPWLGAGVGGGSHVYAATIKRRASMHDFPPPIAHTDLTSYYERAEDMMDVQRYPEHTPYGDIRANRLMRRIGKELAQERPDIVEDEGQINLAISFAPPGEEPGAVFTNKFGARQRYSDPTEQKILGGDIDAKNTLDKNYLHLAQQQGAIIHALCEADRIEPMPDGEGYRVTYTERVIEDRAWKRFRRNWFPKWTDSGDMTRTITARLLVLGAGSIGSTELLMRNRDIHETLPHLSESLGTCYSSNGDYVSIMLPFRGFFISWVGFFGALIGLILANWGMVVVGVLAYAAGLFTSRQEFDPDIGTTNSDYIRFKHRDGSTQGAYIEGGRYPTLLRGGLAFLLSVMGMYRPSAYKYIIRFTNVLRRFVPPFELIARSWPIPLLQMGRDDAVGTFYLNKKGRVEIRYPLSANDDYYNYLDGLAKLIARKAEAWWLPNFAAKWSKRIEVPHNLGGVPMGTHTGDGVVDHAGRVFGYDNLLVLDGSIIPVTLGPNPVGTILALSERAMDVVIEQLNGEGRTRAESTAL